MSGLADCYGEQSNLGEGGIRDGDEGGPGDEDNFKVNQVTNNTFTGV
jgi:hypothetical protein